MDLYPCVVVLILGVTVTGLVNGDTVGGAPEDCNHSGTPVGGDDTSSSARFPTSNLYRLVDDCWRNDSSNNLHDDKVTDDNNPEHIRQALVRICNEDRTSVHKCEENVTASAGCMTSEDQDRLRLYIQLRATILAVSCSDNATMLTNVHVEKGRMDPPLEPGKPDVLDVCYNIELGKDLGTPVDGVNSYMSQVTRNFKGAIRCLEKEETSRWVEVANAYKTLNSAILDNFVCLDQPGGSLVPCKTVLQE